ncbi:MAG: exodeoxyribonuclease VII small subunit [Methylomonas sp.]|nr:exodeoxyribonuclease VII small subunit [Methylomonas sp.]PPD19484.1 MAG: exodeoxyribonuclease VII small subunit [Methylomonas sp.]PPD23397.1 MAG: exodeoxyribonuclease VII small subunit [Methylomonas sp.]PPD29965.1 MAG: exodeoxyribonuclease VII small subunit [Methylomonas sp.]PPD38046.1 MAG: exodeoxyribonuclease VII small subunit [Methylomonas sp.]
MSRRKTASSFEEAMDELEKLVEQMERGDLSLEDALKAFERGIKLTRTCQQALQDAEQKVKILLENNGQPTLEPFNDE